MPSLVVENGRVVDPASGVDGPATVVVRHGKIAFVGAPEEAAKGISADMPRLDARGAWVVPGLVDLHVHFREPGKEAAETIASGAAAAAAGGFTSVACMANTNPPVDSESTVMFVRREAAKAGRARVYPVGCVTAGRKGAELAEMARMARAGAVAFSDDGSSVPASALLRRAMLYAKMLGRPILEHCEDPDLARDGAMNEGFVATMLGLPGIPNEAEDIFVARDVLLARLTGAHVHLQHVSTRGAVEIVRRAKAAGIPVTCETTPHHLTLTEESLREYSTDCKVNPPLRAQADVDACRAGLADGTIDAVATDHAPHLLEEKEVEFAAAPFGLIGLETAVGVLWNDLVHTGAVPAKTLLAALTANPAKILNLPAGTLAAGADADIAIIDPERVWTVEPDRFLSKARNCPFKGRQLKGRPMATVVGGVLVHDGRDRL